MVGLRTLHILDEYRTPPPGSSVSPDICFIDVVLHDPYYTLQADTATQNITTASFHIPAIHHSQ